MIIAVRFLLFGNDFEAEAAERRQINRVYRQLELQKRHLRDTSNPFAYSERYFRKYYR